MNEELEQRIAVMKQEIDGLQIAVTGSSCPWYWNISTLLSIIALLFSFGTTYVSYQRTKSQDIQNARQELRGLLQRLAALPKENVENAKKYADDLAARNLVGGFINQENSLLGKNAAEIARKLPGGFVTATEYYGIAVALQSSYDLTGANEFLEYALDADPDFNTEVAALRMLAVMKFNQGRPETGRVEYQRALDIFSKYQQYDSFTRASTNVLTELSWAFSEASITAFSSALQHVKNAEDLVAPLPHFPGAEMLRAQIQQAKTLITTGAPVPGAVPAMPVTVVPPAISGP